LTSLCRKSAYSLVEVSEDGINLFFVPDDKKPDGLTTLDPNVVFRENTLRNEWSGTRVAEQWRQIEHLPYVRFDAAHS